MNSAYDTFDNIAAGNVIEYFPYETGRIGSVVVRFYQCETCQELHRILAKKAGCPWADNKEMFAVEMFGEHDSEPATVYVMFWDGSMKVGLKGSRRK